MNKVLNNNEEALHLLQKENGVDLKSSSSKTKDNNDNDSNHIHNTKTDSAVFVIFISLFIDLLAFTMILPLFPSLLEFYRINDSKNGLYHTLLKGIKTFQYIVGAPDKYSSVLFGGCLGSMFSFLQYTVSPIVGGLSDVYGRKPILLLCSIGIAISYFLWAISSSFGIFVLARFIGGLSKGNISLSMAVITDVTNVKTRSKAMALVGIAFSLGFIIGPMIGAVFSVYSNKSNQLWFLLPAIFALFLAASDTLFIILFLEETLPKEKRAKKLIPSLSYAMNFIRFSSIFKFAAVKCLPLKDVNKLKRLGFIYFLYLFLYSGLEFTVTFVMYHKFNYSSIDQAKVFLTTGVIMAILQGSVVRKLPMHLVQKSAVFGLYLIIPSFILVGIANNGFLLYLGMILFAISTAFVVTCMTTLVSKYGNHDQKGTVLGIFRSIGALARAIGPIIGSIAFWSIGSFWTYIIGGLLLFYPAYLLQYLELDVKI